MAAITSAISNRLGTIPAICKPIAIRIARNPSICRPNVRRATAIITAPVGSSSRYRIFGRSPGGTHSRDSDWLSQKPSACSKSMSIIAGGSTPGNARIRLNAIISGVQPRIASTVSVRGSILPFSRTSLSHHGSGIARSLISGPLCSSMSRTMRLLCASLYRDDRPTGPAAFLPVGRPA